jgi:cytochrome oxidase assembly protein ShyY1
VKGIGFFQKKVLLGLGVWQNAKKKKKIWYNASIKVMIDVVVHNCNLSTSFIPPFFFIF